MSVCTAKKRNLINYLPPGTDDRPAVHRAAMLAARQIAIYNQEKPG